MEQSATQQPPAETKWYVMGAIKKREIKIRDDMRRKGFTCYVPMRYEVRRIKGRTDRRLVPAIHELVFVRTTKQALLDYKKDVPDTLYFKTVGRRGSHELMVVGDAEMDNFIRLTQHVEEQLTYFRPDEIKLRVGSRIKVHGGIFDGVEGVLTRVPGHRSRQLVVTLTGVAAVAVSLSPNVVEVLDEPKVQKSADIEGDTRRLFTLAVEKLTAPPDPLTQEHEHNLLIAETSRLLPMVSSHRGYTAAREAEIALAAYTATVALRQPADAAATRLQAAAAALKPTSMLRLRLRLYLAALAGDADARQEVTTTLESWKKAPLSAQQRLVAEEAEVLKVR